ncbi:MAG: hypothetical protein EA392_06830 [Cryomorphaceae bacterium]|nr:MAG: hypothetical protein EA392_06830 [Cryomorphaceae bacterium]
MPINPVAMRLYLVLIFTFSFSVLYAQKTDSGYTLVFDRESTVDSRKEAAYAMGLTDFADLHPYSMLAVRGDEMPSSDLLVVFGVKSIGGFYMKGENTFGAETGELFAVLNQGVDAGRARALCDRLNLKAPVSNAFLPHILKIETGLYVNHNEVAQELERSGLFKLVVPRVIFSVSDCSVNDPHFHRQWSLKNNGTALQGNGTPGADIDVELAWEITTGNADIAIAILDSGVDTLHPDLSNKLLPGYDAMDGETQGYPVPSFASDGHGTACAGIAAAETDNGEGVAGVCPECMLIPVRVFTYVELFGQVIPFSDAESFVNGISWQWQVANADVSSNSWGLTDDMLALFPGQDLLVNEAIDAALNQGRDGLGLIMVFSSGNTGDTDVEPIWPSRLPGTFAVNATSMCDERKSQTSCDGENWEGNTGPGLDVSAPGVRISTTDMVGADGYHSSNYYHFFNGTSAACPIVAGVAGLALSLDPGLSRQSLESALRRGCEKIGGYNYDTNTPDGTWSAETGHGRINAHMVLLEVPALNVQEAYHTGVIHLNRGAEHELIVESGLASWWVFDSMGRLVMTQGESNNLILRRGDFASGLYMATWQSGNQNGVVKVLIP